MTTTAQTITIDGKNYEICGKGEGDKEEFITLWRRKEIPQEPKEDDFCLSKLINCDPCFQNQQWIEVYYIKEFIRRLKDKFSESHSYFYEISDSDQMRIIKEIDKLAGDKLK